MNWSKFILSILQLAPVIVAGVETICKGASGKSKQELATQSLVLAGGVAAAVDPDDTETIAAASTVAKAIIDSTVTDLNNKGVLQHAPKAVPVASNPAPVPAVAIGAGVHTTVPA